MVSRMIAVVGIALLPMAGLAEGARKILDCQVVHVCDAAGACKPDSSRVVFTMEPIELEFAGAGEYSISYADEQAKMRAESDSGPFLWNLGQERNASIANSEKQWLWHQLGFDPGPEAAIRFLESSFQQ